MMGAATPQYALLVSATSRSIYMPCSVQKLDNTQLQVQALTVKVKRDWVGEQ